MLCCTCRGCVTFASQGRIARTQAMGQTRVQNWFAVGQPCVRPRSHGCNVAHSRRDDQGDFVELTIDSGADMTTFCLYQVKICTGGMLVKHDGNDLWRLVGRSLGLVICGTSKQIVELSLYKLQDLYCHQLQCREVEKETSLCLMQCRESDCRWFPM